MPEPLDTLRGAPGLQTGDDEALIRERVRRLKARVAEAESNAKSAARDVLRLESELAFAREQLHVRNRAAQHAEQAWLSTAEHTEEVAQALGRAQVELEEVRRQLRGKDWALTKARNDLELLRADRNGRRTELGDHRALQSRIESLQREVDALRVKEREAHSAAEAATGRADELEQALRHSEDVVQALNAQVNETAGELRSTGKELERAREALAKHSDQADSAEALAEAQSRIAALQHDYDALAGSHMTLRTEVQALQQAVVERDLALAGARRELDSARRADVPAAFPGDQAARMDELAEVLAERTTALDTLEENAAGHEYLIRALRDELQAARASLEQHEADYGLLARALRAELECFRSLASERDFVIHHQGQELEDLSRREAIREAAIEEARRLSDPWREKAESAARDRDRLRAEIKALRENVEARDDALSELREELARLHERLGDSDPETVADLHAEIEAKQAELDRSRDRIAFLRKILNDNGLDSTVSPETFRTSNGGLVSRNTPETHSDGSAAKLRAQIAADPAMPSVDIDTWHPNAALQREVEETFTFEFPWFVLLLGAVFAGGCLVLAGLSLFFLV